MIQPCVHCCTRIDNLGVTIGSQVILEKVCLHMNCGELLALVGPNGAGKTTLLRALLGEVPHTGKINFQVKGEVRRPFRIGYVPQRMELDPQAPISVRDFLASAMYQRPVWLGASATMEKEIYAVLSKVAAEPLVARRMGELSGGEMQRVLLAMAMTPVPELLLLDEPVSAVDSKGLALFYEIVSDLRKKHDVSIIIVTHDIHGIAPFADRMVLLNRIVLAEGAPKELLAKKELLSTFGPSLWNVSRTG